MSTSMVIMFELTPGHLEGYKSSYISGDGASPHLISLWDMLQLKAGLFVSIVHVLTSLEETANKAIGAISNEDKRKLLEQLHAISVHCGELGGLDVTVLTIADMVSWAKDDDRIYPFREVAQRLDSIRENLRRELATKYCLALNREEAEHYSNFQKGWEPIIARFPGVIIDVEEARKCFALNRYAAAVFHGTQIVEIGLIELGKFLKDTGSEIGVDLCDPCAVEHNEKRT